MFNTLLQVLDDGRLTDNKGRTVDFKNTILIMTSNVGADIIQTFMENLPPEEAPSTENEPNVEPRSGLYPRGDSLPTESLQKGGEESLQKGGEESLRKEREESLLERREESLRARMLADCRQEVLEVLKRTVRPEFLNRIDEVIMFEPLSQTDIREILRIQIRDLQSKLSENGVTIEFTQEFEDYMSTKGYEPAYGARPVKRLMQKELVNLLAKSILDGHVRRDSVILIDVKDGQILISQR